MLPPDSLDVPLIKLIIIGSSGVGKSALLLRYCEDTFEEGDTTTIGVDLKMKTLQVHGKPYKLRIWDTAGQERYRTITNSYYRGAHGIFIVYDVCRQDTFNALPRWIEETEVHCSGLDKPVVRYIVANKIDEKDIRVVSRDTALTFIESMQQSSPAKENGASSQQSTSEPYYQEFSATNPSISKFIEDSPTHIDGYFEVSAKNSDGVRNMFVSMVEQIIASGVLNPPLSRPASRLGDYSSWAIPSVVDLSRPLSKTVGKCYASC